MKIFGIILTNTDLWLLGICGVLGMAWIAYRFNDTLNKRKFFRIAAAKFRKSLNSEHDINIFNSYTIGRFKEVFATHKEASRIFTGSITGRKRIRFDKAWKEYEQWANEIFIESAYKSDGVYALTLAHKGRHFAQEIKNHIDSLLKLAKQT